MRFKVSDKNLDFEARIEFLERKMDDVCMTLVKAVEAIENQNMINASNHSMWEFFMGARNGKLSN